MFLRVIASAILVAILGSPSVGLACGTGQSCLPDNDATALNNSFESAEDLGLLGSDVTGQPRTVTVQGELGHADNGFDTVDFYKFRLPLNQFEVAISSTESPSTTSWIMIYDQNRQPLVDESQVRGHDNESVTLNLSSGFYYVVVRTDGATAGNRLLKYTLTIKPSVRPLPDQGVGDCRSAPSPQQAVSGRIFSGSLAAPFFKSSYAIYITNGTGFMAAPSGFPQIYQVTLIDRPTGDRIVVPKIPQAIAIDPGLYCLEVSASEFGPSTVNYQFNIGVPNMGFPPEPQRDSAHCVTMLNLGNLSTNGRYGTVRQPQASNPGTPCSLETSTQYVMREWIGPQRSEGWFQFDLQEPRKLELRMTNLYDPARAEIQDRTGNVLATSVVEGISLTDQLPPQVLSRTLGAGRYFLRTIYTGTRQAGTNMQIWMVANPP
ncbi:MAG TPA: hypothetical protein VFB31_12625 [Pseudolabrys sp.]|nr:hypothetical protein [Pseudolabrys sp.]